MTITPNHHHTHIGLYVFSTITLQCTWENVASRMKHCYLWIDFTCINQNQDPAGELKFLDDIVAVSDCIFTPCVDNDWRAWCGERMPVAASVGGTHDTSCKDGKTVHGAVQSDDYGSLEFDSINQVRTTINIYSINHNLHSYLPLYQSSSFLIHSMNQLRETEKGAGDDGDKNKGTIDGARQDPNTSGGAVKGIVPETPFTKNYFEYYQAPAFQGTKYVP